MVDHYVIRGGDRLSGRVRISGSKNAVLPMLAATMLTGHRCRIIDAPWLRDVDVMLNILRRLGVRVAVTVVEGKTCLEINAENLTTHEVPESLVREMRSSIFMMGPMLGRLGKVRISYPGGCSIGPRPVDYHLRGLQALGAVITECHGFIEATADQLIGADVHLDFPSVGTTENLMMAAVCADGETMIRNAAKEPEIVDLQTFLNSSGAHVRGAGTDTIRIEGPTVFGGTDHTVIPDRIEAGTFMAVAAATGSDIELINVIPEHLDAPIAKLREAGCDIKEAAGTIRITVPGRVQSVDCKTLPYPGFPTDLQPQFMAMLAVADGTSIITETVFENRFNQAEELRRMGANIKTESRTAVIKGVRGLSGAAVDASDLRSGAALVIAGLTADGETRVGQIAHIDRGYEGLEEKLWSLGANITRVSEQLGRVHSGAIGE